LTSEGEWALSELGTQRWCDVARMESVRERRPERFTSYMHTSLGYLLTPAAIAVP